MNIKIQRFSEDVRLPEYGHPGDAGLDVYAREDATIAPGAQYRFALGFALELPDGYAGIMKDKSSRARVGLHVLGGVFDAGYRGEYDVRLVNTGEEAYTISAGEKVAQLLILPVASASLTEADTLSSSSRGTGAYGSTGTT